MSNNIPGQPAPTEQAIRTWLVEHVAEAASMTPDDIDMREPLESYGLSSREAVSMVGDLEDWLGRRLSPTLVWEYPTIEALARYLNGPAPKTGPAQAAKPAPAELQPATTAADLAELSDEEAEALLLQKLDDLGQ